MQLIYECSDGTKIDLMSFPIVAQNPEVLTESSWKYSAISAANNIGKITKFYKDVQECTLTLSIMADSEEQFNEIMYRLHRAFEKDVRSLNPGKIWWNDWSKEVFAYETGNESYEEGFEAVEKKVKILSANPQWIRTKTWQFVEFGEEEGAIDFNFDYDDLDFGREEMVEVIENDCIDKANFEIVFYGPAINPAITIGDHVYELLVDLDEYEFATVDSRKKEIYKYSANGQKENIFHLRSRESYVVEPIPAGVTSLSRDRNTKVDVTLYDERGEPVWI